MLEQAQRIVSAGAGDNGHRRNVSRLVAEGNAQSQGKQHGKPEDPEDDLGLAFEFQQARHQQMIEAGPAAVARRRSRGSRRDPCWRNLLCDGH